MEIHVKVPNRSKHLKNFLTIDDKQSRMSPMKSVTPEKASPSDTVQVIRFSSLKQFKLGVLAFRLTDEERSGYIIINNKGTRPLAIVVMDDNRSLDPEDKRRLKHFEKFPVAPRLTRSKMFVVYTSTTNVKSVSYVGQPFCSLYECYIKSRLVTATCKIARLDPFGAITGSLIISLRPHLPHPTFGVYLRSQHRDGSDSLKFSSRNLLETGRYPDRPMNVKYRKVVLELNPPSTLHPTMLSLLNRLNDIATDDEFLVQLSELKKQLNTQRDYYFEHNV